jgi:hypothetical protein
VTWLDTLLARGDEAKRADSVPSAPVRQPAEPRLKAVIRTVSVQTAAPFGGSPGAITVGYYSVQDDVVVMHDEAGILTGKRQHLRAGEDPRGVAYRLARESWQAKTPDFNRALNYRPAGVA